MSKPELRASQVVTTYGPGAMVDLPDDAVIVASLDQWRFNKNQPLPVVDEPRLKRKVEIALAREGLTLRSPPAAVEDKGFTPDIAAYRFPIWVISQHQTVQKGYRDRRLIKQDDLEKGRFRDDDGRMHSVVPVRFVRACRKGHVDDIDWYAFVHGHGSDCRRELFIEERGTSGDLDAVWVRCACGQNRPMAQAARMELGALGACRGARPWLGPGTREKCGEPSRLLIRSASNAYFPQLLSVISIPAAFDEVDRVVAGLWESHLSAVESIDELKIFLRTPALRQQLEQFTPEQVMAAIERQRGAAEDDRPVKEVEFEALAAAKDELGVDVPDGDFYARALRRDLWEGELMRNVERVVLVHRLREVVAQLGFTRFEAAGPDIQGELDLQAQRAALALDANWLPAVENRGEGVFIQFKAEAIRAWHEHAAAVVRDKQLAQGFDTWLHEHEGSRRIYPGLPYIMLHSLSHLLLTAISLECGYPCSSLRERVYARTDRGQFGILIYTGSADSEGTLGGLVETGRKIKGHLERALEAGRLCSNDPVCAFHSPTDHDQQPLLGSACHGCLLISETSCEQRNDFLDRALVVPTVELIGAEFFPENA